MRHNAVCNELRADSGISLDDLCYLICNSYIVRGIESGKVLDVLGTIKDSSENFIRMR